MKKHEIGEQETLESIANANGTSMASIKSLNKDLDLTGVKTGDSINIPDGPLPDLDHQQKENEVVRETEPRENTTEFAYVDNTNGEMNYVSNVNPNHEFTPKEIDEKEYTPNSDEIANVQLGDLKRGIKFKTNAPPVKEQFKSSEKAFAQALTKDYLGIDDENNKNEANFAYSLPLPFTDTSDPVEVEETEQMFGEFSAGAAKGFLGVPNMAIQAKENVSETLTDREMVEVDNITDLGKNIGNLALDVVGTALFPTNWASDKVEEFTGINPIEQRNKKLSNIMDMSYDEGNQILDDDEKRIESIKSTIKKYTKPDQKLPDGTLQRMAENVDSRVREKAKAIKSDTEWSGTIGEVVGTLPLAVLTELGVFNTAMRAMPAVSNPVLSYGKTGLASVASGFSSGGLQATAESKSVNEILNRGMADASLNLGIDVFIPGAVATTAKTVDWSGSALKHAERALGIAEDYTPDDSFKKAQEYISKASKADSEEEALVWSRMFKNRMQRTELDPKIDDVSSRITNNFQDIFGTREPNKVGDFLEYKYGKRAIPELSNTELFHLDNYLEKAKIDDEFGERISETFTKYMDDKDSFRKQMSSDDANEEFLERFENMSKSQFKAEEERILKETDEKLLEESEWFNTKSILASEDDPDNPLIRKLLSDENFLEGKPGNVRLSDIGRDKDNFWDTITKWIGPNHIMAQRTEATSGVPMGLAVRELEDAARRSQSEFRNGLGDAEGLVGLDEFFSSINMYKDQNKELQDDVFRFMMDKEYNMEEITEEAMENSEYIRTEEQKELVRFARDWFDEVFKYTDLSPQDFIKNYTPRRLLKDSGEKGVAKDILEYGQLGDPLPKKGFFEKERSIGDVTFEEYKGYIENMSSEDFNIEIDTDLQRIMKSYMWSLTRKRHLNSAMDAFKRQTDKLVADGHKDAKYWKNWAKEVSGNVEGGSSFDGLTNWVAKGLDALDRNLPGGRSTSGQKFREFLENNSISDLIMEGTYGQYLFADQMFRFMNAGQTALTKARLGEENFAKSFFDPANNKRLLNMFGDQSAAEARLDRVLQDMNVRGPSDQFITNARTEFGANVQGKEANKSLLQKARHKLFSFDNISASDRFNVRNAFYTATDTLDRYVDDYKSGSITWDEFVQETNLHRANHTVRTNIKDSIDNGNIGALTVTKGTDEYTKGTNIRVNEYLSMDAEQAKQLEFDFDQKSAEAIFGKDTVYNTQWNYGKGAMGRAFWREGMPATGKLIQASTLPFQTWWVNMLYQTKDMLVDNPANADQMVNLLTTQTAYADAASKIFEEDTDRWIAPMSIPTRPFSSPPGQALVSAFTVANLAGKESIRTDGLNRFNRMKKGESMNRLAQYLYGSGTIVGRAQGVIDESMELWSSGSMNRQDLIDMIDSATGVRFKNLTAKEYAENMVDNFGDEL